MSRFLSRYRAGDWVEVKSKEEILDTLDSNGCFEGLPFMPEMLRHCGRTMRVFKSAHKTCDTVNHTGGRRMRNAVHLQDVRCDGSAHGGCQAACLIFWKEQWLKPAQRDEIGERRDQRPVQADPTASDAARLSGFACRLDDGDGTPTYRCQATQLYDATSALSPWNIRQYVADVRSGNVAPSEAAKFLLLAFLFNLRKLGIGYRIACRLHEFAHRRLVGRPGPYRRGRIPADAPTPLVTKDLHVGDMVEVKPYEEILETLNSRNRNRGMSFDKEMVRYCGQRFRIADCVSRIINEKSGKMMEFSRPSYILQDAYCRSQYSERRMLCPRGIVQYWRDAWVNKVGGAVAEFGATGAATAGQRSDGRTDVST